MGILNIIPNPFSKKIAEDSNYLSLCLTPDKVLAIIWVFDGEKVEILGFAKKSYQNIESLIHQAARVIDMAAEAAKSDVSEVVFGLSAQWFYEGQITKDTQKQLKKLSDELELNAQAFVPFSSSVKNYLKIEESITPHAVLVGIYDELMEVHLIKNNEVEGTKISTSKPTLEKIATVIRQLAQDKSLPSRLIIFGLIEGSKLAEEISKKDWKDVFLHQPKIEFIDDNELAKSVSYAQASDILGHEPTLIPSSKEKEIISSDDELKKEKQEADELGFIEGEDILETKEKPQEE